MLIRYGNDPQLSQFSILCNTGDGEVLSNIAHSSRLGLPEIDEMKPNGLPAIICGGGPSLGDTLVSIRALKAGGGIIFALNNTAKFLTEHGIRPDYHVVLDPRPYNVDFLEKAWADEALLCSQCHPDMFARCEELGYKARLWHPALKDAQQHIPQKEPLLISVTTTVGLSVLSLVHVLGFREFHLFGYDSCHRKESSHAYGQPRNADDEIVRIVVDSQVFYGSMAMACQASQFKQLHDMLTSEHCASTVKVYGDGLIPALYAKWELERAERILTAVYDLGVSPPSYDFLSFLIEAERYRRENGFTAIDLMFQPGPMHGFRDDDLPPGTPEREWMLWGICVGMAKLMPSVRNIDVKKTRWHPGSADVFPVDYKEDQPLSHYGTGFLKGGEPMLRASDHARSVVPKTRYATISIRHAPYWPDRNSNLAEWDKVAAWLFAQGIEPIFIPDANGPEAVPSGWKTNTVAAQNIDLRAALYEGAVINLGVLNGPMSLLPFLKAKYLIFNIVVETAVASTTEFLKAHGFENGDQMGGDGRLVWEPDTADVIIRELKSLGDSL